MAAIRLEPRRIEKVWGRRDLGAPFGDVAEEAEPVGEIWFEAPDGRDPALLVKYLFTSERLSIQVHPDDAAARARGEPRGKDEAWLVLAADPGATIGLGLTRTATPEALRTAALDGSLERLVDWRPVRAGDVFYSPAGTIHAIGAGLKLVEIQQNVDLTYRLYDYGRPRELHLDQAVAVARPEPFAAEAWPVPIAERRLRLCEGPALWIDRCTGPAEIAIDTLSWIVPLAGAAALDGEPLDPGSVWLAEAGAALALGADADLLIAAEPRN